MLKAGQYQRLNPVLLIIAAKWVMRTDRSITAARLTYIHLIVFFLAFHAFIS